MPEINDLELQKQLINNNISFQVIMISDTGGISTVVKAIKSGILNFLENSLIIMHCLSLFTKL